MKRFIFETKHIEKKEDGKVVDNYVDITIFRNEQTLSAILHGKEEYSKRYFASMQIDFDQLEDFVAGLEEITQKLKEIK